MGHSVYNAERAAAFRSRGLVSVGLNFQRSEDLVQEVVNLSQWQVAPFVVEITDAASHLHLYPLEEGEVEAPQVERFLRENHVVFPARAVSLRGTGLRLD